MTAPAKHGIFITVEGAEGSGKSSQIRSLVATLRRVGYLVVLVQDPGSTALGRKLRQFLLHGTQALSPMAEALLFLGGRAQLIEERIAPALARGQVVVCDRFHDSTVAYQGFGGGLDVTWLNQLGRAAIRGVMPQMTILLDVPTATGFARLTRRLDRMERKARAFHQRVRAGYLALAHREPKRFSVVDASRSPDVVRAELEALVLQRLHTRVGILPHEIERDRVVTH